MKKLFKTLGFLIWFWISVPVLILTTASMIGLNTFGYDFMCLTFGAERAGGRGDGRYFEVEAKSKDEAYENGNKLNEAICEEGFVLLKNQNNALPLTKGNKISVFGKNSVNLVYGGSGSGGGKYSGAPTIFDSLEAAGFEYNPVLRDFYENKSASGEGRPANPKIENSGSETLGTGETAQASYTKAVKDSYSSYNDCALVVISRIGGEGFDLPYSDDTTEHYLELDKNERDLIQAVTNGSFKKVVVVVNTSNIIEMGAIQNNPKIDGAIFIGGPGYSGINALGRILNGSVNPSGKTVDTWGSDFTHNPTWNNFANNGQAGGGTYTKGGKATKYYFVDYEETIYVGYRYYETRGSIDGEEWYNKEVVYPFGYGLSYTTFDWKLDNKDQLNGKVIDDNTKNNEIEFKVTVTNTGKVAGKDTVELYADAPYSNGGIQKASTVLVGFAKTKELKPGESETLTIKFNPYYASSYDYSDANGNGFKGYELEQGDYVLSLKESAHTVKGENKVTLKANAIKYDVDPVTGNKVENRFSDADDELDVLLSRDNFNGTWPTRPNGHALEDYESFSMKDFQNMKPNSPEVKGDMPTQGAPVKHKLIELRGKAWDDPMWDEIINTMTFEQMKDVFNKGAYRTVGVDEIGFPAGLASDGPVGWTNFMGESDIYGATSYANETVLASTWSLDLLEKMGKSVGEEAAFGNQKTDPYVPYTGWYAPGVNIHRSPFGGRNFEYFSEDGFLTGMLASSEIKGAKSKGLITYMKHFALNEQETHRDDNGVATWSTEQAMREIYLKPFEIATKVGKSNGLMSSFNRIGTKWTGGDYRLLTEVLRNEWGFVGTVICDFNVNVYMNSKQMAYAGGDLNLTTTRPWSKADPTNAADVITLRRCVHNLMYCITNSNAMNGIKKNTKLGTLMPYWQVLTYWIGGALISSVVVSGAIVVPLAIKKNKKAENPEA